MKTKEALKIIYELIIYNEELVKDEDFSECWKAYEHLESKNENKWSIKNYRRLTEQAIKDAWLVNRPPCQRMQDRREAAEGKRLSLL